MSLTDTELVERARMGDKEAFGLLVQRYRAAVYGVAYAQVGNFDDAQDVAQEAFVAAYLDLPQLRDAEKFAPWLRRVTLNVCAMWRRKRREEPMPPDELPESVDADTVTAEAERRERQAQVWRALRQLPDSQRLVATLYYLHDLAYADIARFLGTSPTVVKGRLQRAREQLRKEMVKMMRDVSHDTQLPDDFAEQVIQQVLVVEDDQQLAQQVEDDLRSIGYDALHAKDGRTVLDDIRRLRPRIVILNEIMPGANGIELVERMKADEGLRGIPVVLLVTDTSDATIHRVWKSGADVCLHKPYSPEELMRYIGHLDRSMDMRELVEQGRTQEIWQRLRAWYAANSKRETLISKLSRLVECGYLDEAIEEGQKQLAEKPEDASVYFHLSRAYAWKGETQTALQYLRAAMERDKWMSSPARKEPAFIPLRANAEFRQILLDATKKQVEDNPDNPSFHSYYLATVNAMQGDDEQALHHLSLALEGQPGYVHFARDNWFFDRLRDHPEFQSLIAQAFQALLTTE